MTQEKVQVYAVIRVDRHTSNIEDAVTVKEVLPSLEEAKLEVDRLNQLSVDRDCYYFWQTTRYFPSGR